MENPYLVQRAFLKQINSNYKISEAFELDYMGSSEFEFGAIPKSLRASQARKLAVHTVQVNAQKVFLICEKEEVNEYLGWLYEIAKGFSGRRLKEAAHFDWVFNPKEAYSKVPDLWWDIDNHVAWTIREDVAKQFVESLNVSVKFMEEQKKK